MTGIAKISRNEVTSVIQTNSGIRNSVIPGARMFRIVTMKFSPEAIEATPRIWSPNSPEVHAVAGRVRPSKRGSSNTNQPQSGAPKVALRRCLR